ncbi:sensor histidine kinase [Anaeromicropila populeti]|uniref:Two-component system, sensor histidine kinase YesM n=1 Tax=Anaeromicropila populeti TaxID=37658 RepID=A0A1I6IG79_9FIRM|nr:histidine kinase [Anaeromicropila populeti]SFR65671.1 two-component system, sensor histidine kinase YesM [Anaeromicropila populeti]
MIRKKTIYRKLFINYTAIIFSIIIFFEVFSISNVRKQAADENIRFNQLVSEEVANNAKNMSDTADLILYKLYQKDSELSDTLLYLENDLDTYYQIRLDRFSNNQSNEYYGNDDFAKESFSLDSQIKEISFVSHAKKHRITYSDGGDVRVSEVSSSFLERLNQYILLEDNHIVFVENIQNPMTMELTGYMLVSYNLSYFEKNYKENKESELIVFYDQTVLFDSTGKNTVDYLLNDSGVLKSEQELEKILAAYVCCYGMNKINVVRYIPKEIGNRISPFLMLSLIVTGIFIFGAGEFLVLRRLEHLTQRLVSLLNGMERVRGGEINSQVEIKFENDEYDIIAEYFNQMCTDLQTYIQKSYMAEIEQKNAELNALQNQINPHFLYNTLEAIRMKAICNGDKEVGKMLYGLAIIFRSQVKESSIITIGKELYFCKKYLEMFEFRYQNKFRFAIDCPVEFMEVKVNKFILQPMIENYFVHGIRLMDTDNYLCIKMEAAGEDILIYIEDNGKGIEDNRLEEINQKLKDNSSPEGSIGVRNVNSRITAMYGKEYGVHLEKNDPRGVRVIIRFPMEV